MRFGRTQGGQYTPPTPNRFMDESDWFDDEPIWLRRFERGDFADLPADIDFEGCLWLMLPIADGYSAARKLAFGELHQFAQARLAEAERCGEWRDSTVALYFTLWWWRW